MRKSRKNLLGIEKHNALVSSKDQWRSFCPQDWTEHAKAEPNNYNSCIEKIEIVGVVYCTITSVLYYYSAVLVLIRVIRDLLFERTMEWVGWNGKKTELKDHKWESPQR